MTARRRRSEPQAGQSPREGSRTLLALIAAAFLVRVAVRIAGGTDSFFEESYGFYRRIAETFVAGGGLCVSPHSGCALRPPLYPLLLSPLTAAGVLFPGAVLLQAAAAALMTWFAFDIGRRVFTPTAGLWAAGLTALSPYAVVHDTALQETSLVNLFTMVALWMVSRATGPHRRARLFGAGVALGAGVMTTARVALFIPAACAWVTLSRGTKWREGWRDALVLALPAVLMVGGWMTRNARVVGAPVFTTESGASLFYANNEWTFSAFPRQSIDVSARNAVASLSVSRREALARVAGDAVAEDALVRGWAYDYIRTRPASVFAGVLRKTSVVLTAEYSPERGAVVGAGYRVLYGLIHVLAAVGLWHARRRGPPHGFSYAILGAFLVTTAIFWAHTSHKSVIDGVLFVYAGGTLARIGSLRVQPRAARP